MAFARATEQQVDAMRAEFPDHWVCEVVKGKECVLIAVPATEQNAKRVIDSLPGIGFTGDMLDGASFDFTPQPEIVASAAPKPSAADFPADLLGSPA